MLAADSGASWTLTGANTIGTVLDSGKLEVAGGLDVSAALDPTSAGTFQIDQNASLEALGSGSAINFVAGSKLVVDNFSQFGEGIGTSGYTGSRLEDFGGSTVDLKGFAPQGCRTASRRRAACFNCPMAPRRWRRWTSRPRRSAPGLSSSPATGRAASSSRTRKPYPGNGSSLSPDC